MKKRLHISALYGCAIFLLSVLSRPCVAKESDAPSLEDLQLTPGPEISLAQALARAQEQNLLLASMKQEIEKSQALFSKSLGLVLPTAQASLSYTHLDHGSEVDLSGMIGALTQQAVQLDPMTVQQQETLNGSISIRQSIVNVSDWFTVKAAGQAETQATLSVEKMQRELSLQVARSYFLALSSFHLTTLQQRLLVSARDHLRIAENRYAAGSGVRLDVLRARADLEDTEQALSNARLAFDTARDALGVLIGMDGDGLPMPTEVLLPPAPVLDDETLIENALAERTDLSLERERVETAKIQKTAAWTALLPALSAVWQGTALLTDPPDMADPDRERWSLMLSLTVPLFNSAIYADMKHRSAAHRQAVINAENLEQTAKKEVRQAKREYITAVHDVETADRRVRILREALVLTQRAFRSGAGSSLDVTDARKNVAAGEVNLITARLRAQSSLLSLLHAAGTNIATVVE